MDVLGVLVTLRDSFVVSLASGFVECLLLVMFVDAVRRGHRVYALAVLGMSMALLGRISEGFMEPGPDNILKIAGLVLAALVVTLDIVTEEVDPNQPETVP
jgi:hypothetical protein